MITDKLGNITLYNADCMELLREMPDNAYDLAIVDPPYGDGKTENGGVLGTIRATIRPIQESRATSDHSRGDLRNTRGRFARYALPPLLAEQENLGQRTIPKKS